MSEQKTTEATILNVTEAAELLHLHPHTLSDMARRGEVPCAKPGKRYIFIKEDLIEWIRSRYGKHVKQPEAPSTVSVADFLYPRVTEEDVLRRLKEFKHRPR